MTFFGQDWLFSDWKKHFDGRQSAFVDDGMTNLGRNWSFFDRGITNLGQERLCCHQRLLFPLSEHTFALRLQPLVQTEYSRCLLQASKMVNSNGINGRDNPLILSFYRTKP